MVQPRQSFSAAIAESMRDYAHVFETSTILHSQKSQELKIKLPGDSEALSNSILSQRWWDLALKFSQGGTYLARSFVPEASLANSLLKAGGEGGVISGVQSFIDSGYSASQTITQGKKTINETMLSGMMNATSTPDQIISSLLQVMNRVSEIADRL